MLYKTDIWKGNLILFFNKQLIYSYGSCALPKRHFLFLQLIQNFQISRENSQVKETLQQIEEAKSETSSVADSSEKIQETENQKIRNSAETSEIGSSPTDDQNEQ